LIKYYFSEIFTFFFFAESSEDQQKTHDAGEL